MRSTTRTKKIRPTVRVKERIAKKGGRCAACRIRYEKGDEVTVVNIRRKTYHRHGCVPANVGQLPTATGPSVIGDKPEDVVKALSSNWSIGEAKLVAMLALENAMVVVAKKSTITPEMEKAFDRYGKVKNMFLRPGSEQEEKQAARLSILEIVKTFF